MVRTSTAARRADDAHLARLVRDLERGCRLAAADDRPERALPQPRARRASTSCFLDVTHDPAMLLWLNGTENVKGAPNENYGREMMELFTLGADRGAYTEEDVRQQARSLTGWQNRWSQPRGDDRLPLRPGRARRRRQARLRLERPLQLGGRLPALPHPPAAPVVLRHRSSGRTSSRRPPDAATLAGLEALYRQGYSVKPVVGAILRHPDLHAGERMVKPPIVHIAGLLRRIGAGITTTDWAWIGQLSGQQLFYPPNVAGWDDTRWLDTATFLGRWIARLAAPAGPPAQPESAAARTAPPDAADARRPGRSRSGATRRSRAATLRLLARVRQRALGDGARPTGSRRPTPRWSRTRLRQLIAVSPDLQTA